jgi:hypothetical protein
MAHISLAFSCHFDFGFGGVAKTSPMEYHLRLGGDRMAEWADKFAERFKADRQKVLLSEKRADQRSDLIKSKAPGLWKDLKDSLALAAQDISGKEAFLKYEYAAGEGNKATLKYAQGLTPDRSAEITFSNNHLHVLVASARRGGISSRDYEVAENDSADDVWFAERGRPGQTNQMLIEAILNSLLESR